MTAAWTARERSGIGKRQTLIIAAVFGLVSAFLIYRLLANTQGKGVGGATVPVLVAARDIPARTILTDQDVTVRQMAPSLKLATAATDLKTTVGHVARSPISAGEQLLSSRLADSVKDVGFAGQVPQGLRGVSISVGEVMTAGGLLQPGDAVDVIGVFNRIDTNPDTSSFLMKGDKPSRLVALTVLQDVQVLAVAQAATDPLAQASAKSASKAQPDAKTITLAVTPEDAQKLFLVDQTGTLRLALHHFGDHETAPLPSIDNTVNDIYGLTTGSANPPAGPAAPPATPQATPRTGSPTH